MLAGLRSVEAINTYHGGPCTAYSCLDVAGNLLPGLAWVSDVRHQKSGYSLVTNGQSRWAVNDAGMMMFSY